MVWLCSVISALHLNTESYPELAARQAAATWVLHLPAISQGRRTPTHGSTLQESRVSCAGRGALPPRWVMLVRCWTRAGLFLGPEAGSPFSRGKTGKEKQRKRNRAGHSSLGAPAGCLTDLEIAQHTEHRDGGSGVGREVGKAAAGREWRQLGSPMRWHDL